MKIPFIKAKNFTKGRGGKKVKLIVIHTMESGEQPNKAKQVALWFAGKTAPDASAHYLIGNETAHIKTRGGDAFAANLAQAAPQPLLLGIPTVK